MSGHDLAWLGAKDAGFRVAEFLQGMKNWFQFNFLYTSTYLWAISQKRCYKQLLTGTAFWCRRSWGLEHPRDTGMVVIKLCLSLQLLFVAWLIKTLKVVNLISIFLVLYSYGIVYLNVRGAHLYLQYEWISSEWIFHAGWHSWKN